MGRLAADDFDLVDLVYQAAFDPALWRVFLQKFNERTGTIAAGIFQTDFKAQSNRSLADVGIDPSYLRLYWEYYHTVNPLILRPRRIPQQDEVLLATDVVDEDAFRGEFYNDFLLPQDQAQMLLGIPVANGYTLTTLNAFRPRNAAPFGAAEQDLLRRLLPHIRRSIAVHLRLDAVESEARLAEEILDRLPVGILIVDAQGKVLRLNPAAADLVDARDGLMLAPSGLAAHRHVETTRLAELIQSAARTAKGNAAHPGGALRITRPSGKTAYSLMVTPLRGGACALGHEVMHAALGDYHVKREAR